MDILLAALTDKLMDILLDMMMDILLDTWMVYCSVKKKVEMLELMMVCL